MRLTIHDLFAVQRDSNKLKSLYMELADLENFNPYKGNVISDMPKGNKGKNFSEWYTEEKDRIENDIEFYKKKLKDDRESVNAFIKAAPYPECEIIQYRVLNNLGWEQIGELLYINRRTASRKFYDYMKKENLPTMPVRNVV